LDDLGIKQRRVGSVTVLDTDSVLRIPLKFGRSRVSLARAVESLMNSGQRRILLDLGRVESISAKDMGELISKYVEVTKGGGQFKLFNLTKMVRQLMTATNLSAVFAFYESEQHAIESFAREAPATNEIAWPQP
jgi:anti-anti-sigma factor